MDPQHDHELSAWQMVEQLRYEQHLERERSIKAVEWSALALILVTMVGSVVPVLGFLMWFAGWLFCFVVLILAIVLLAKGAVGRGLVAMFCALIFLPGWIVVAPVVSTSIAGVVGSAVAPVKVVSVEALPAVETPPEEVLTPPLPPAVLEALKPVPPSPTPYPMLKADLTKEMPQPIAIPKLMPRSDFGTFSVTSRDGRSIQGVVTAIEPWGVRMRRVDGLEVDIRYELMSESDAARLKQAGELGLK